MFFHEPSMFESFMFWLCIIGAPASFFYCWGVSYANAVKEEGWRDPTVRNGITLGVMTSVFVAAFIAASMTHDPPHEPEIKHYEGRMFLEAVQNLEPLQDV